MSAICAIVADWEEAADITTQLKLLEAALEHQARAVRGLMAGRPPWLHTGDRLRDRAALHRHPPFFFPLGKGDHQ